jgi:hypothetical protein
MNESLAYYCGAKKGRSLQGILTVNNIIFITIITIRLLTVNAVTHAGNKIIKEYKILK